MQNNIEIDKKKALDYKHTTVSQEIRFDKLMNDLYSERVLIVYGSCDYATNTGIYHYVLTDEDDVIFNEHKESEIKSPNDCMLIGIKEAINHIQNPVAINLVVATELGFDLAFRNKGANLKLVLEIYELLISKGCVLRVYVLNGKGEDIQRYVSGFFNDKPREFKDKKERKQVYVKSYEQKIYERCMDEVAVKMNKLGIEKELIFKITGIGVND